MRHHFNWVLDLLMPGEGHALLLLNDHGDGEPAAMRDALVAALNDNLDEDRRFRPSHSAVLTALPGALGVAIEHMLDEYWWVEFHPVREDHTGTPRLVNTTDPAVAVLRDNLPFDHDLSSRLTPLTSQKTAAQRARVIEDFSRGQ